jgi:amidase
MPKTLSSPGPKSHGFCGRRSFQETQVAAVEKTAKQLETLGHGVEVAEPDYDVEALGESFMAIFAAATAQAIEDHAAATGQTPSTDNLECNNLWLLERGRAMSAVDLERALLGINTATRNFARFFEDYDIWLTPTMATPPPPLGHLYADVDDVELFFERLWTFNPLNSIYNAAGQPAITLPLHMSEDGLPIGVMLGARFGEESLLLRLSAQLETAMPWADRHPPIGLWGGNC